MQRYRLRHIMRFFTFLYLATLLNTLSVANANNLELVKMGYIDFAPFTYTKAGKPMGAQIELAQDISRESGVQFTMVEMPLHRMQNEIISGRIHFWIGTPGMKPLQNKTLESSMAVGRILMKLYSVSAELPNKLHELHDTSLVVIMGFGYGGMIDLLKDPRQNITLLEASNHKSAFAMLRAGRARYVLNYHMPSELILVELGMSNVKNIVIQELPIHFIVSKKAPAPERLLTLLEESTRRIMKKRNTDTMGTEIPTHDPS